MFIDFFRLYLKIIYSKDTIFFVNSQYQRIKKRRKSAVKFSIIIKINFAIVKTYFFNNFIHNFVVENKQSLPKSINDSKHDDI